MFSIFLLHNHYSGKRLVLMVSWFGDWFHTAINSMHERSAAQCCLVVQLLALVLGLACNWPQRCADSGWDLVAFGDLQGCVTTRSKCGFNGQEMGSLQNGSDTVSWRKFEREKMCELRWEVHGETAGESWFLCLLSPKVPSVSGDDTAPR